MGFIIVSVGVIALGYGIWKTTFRNAYESADYSVVAKDNDILEIRITNMRICLIIHTIFVVLKTLLLYVKSNTLWE